MTVAFNAQTAGDLKATIQFEFSGNQKGEWFLSIGSGKCHFHEGKLDSPTLTIKAPSEVLLAIGNKEIDEEQAIQEGNYNIDGDLDLQARMKSLFVGLG